MTRKPSIGALIEVLKQQKSELEIKTWDELENHVQHVYETLLSLEEEQIVVARNVQMRGRHGQNHQVDVYYEFEKAGVRHRVAFECKNTRRPTEIGKVRDFFCVVNDCPGVIGMMVSASGYQPSAKKFAEDNGIVPITLEQLPSVSYLLGLRLEHGMIPDEKSIGQPFWTLFEMENGKLNGTPYGNQHGNDIYSILFFSKKQATEFLHAMNLQNTWVVRGLSQLHLQNFIMMVDALAGIYTLFQPAVNEHDEAMWGGVEIARADLIAEYCAGDIWVPKEPMVMPSRRKYMRPYQQD